jgi:hypothetical protein
MGGHVDSVWQVSLRPTFRSRKTKLALGAWICFYLIAAGRVIWTDHSDATQTIATLRANNQVLGQRLQAGSRETLPTVNTVTLDEANRFRALRDHHLELLRPVLRSESEHLRSLAEEIKTQGHVAPMREGEAKASSSAELCRRS